MVSAMSRPTKAGVVKRRIGLFDSFVILALLLIGIATLYPVVHVFSVSLSHPDEVLAGSVGWYPRRIDFNAYIYIFRHHLIPTGYKNTILYTSVGTAINIVFTCMAAYPLARKSLPFRKIVTAFMVFTMYFSGGLIPTFLLIRNLGMVNTIWALVIPPAIAVWNLIILRTFFQRIPDEMAESALLDGASGLRILFSIIIPLSKAAIAVIALFYVVNHWNGFMAPLIYLRDAKKYPLQIIIRDIVLGELLLSKMEEFEDLWMEWEWDDEINPRFYTENFRYAVIFVSVIPLLLIYPFLQRYFVKGVMIGSLKA